MELAIGVEMPQLKPTRGICLNRSHHLSRGLVAFWLFNEGSGGKVNDLSGNGNHLTQSGGVVWIPGRFGSANRLDGDDDYLTAPDSTSLDIGGAISIVIMFKASSLAGDDAGLMSKGSDVTKYFGSAAQYVYQMGIYNNDIYWAISDGTNREWATGNVSSYIDGKWHQLVGVWDGDQYLAVWVDGIEKFTNTAIATTSIQNLSSVLDIGGYTTDYNYSGDIDHALLYNRFLCDFEIDLLKRKPFGMFEAAASPKVVVTVPARAARRGIGFKPIQGADRLRGLRRNALY